MNKNIFYYSCFSFFIGAFGGIIASKYSPYLITPNTLSLNEQQNTAQTEDKIIEASTHSNSQLKIYPKTQPKTPTKTLASASGDAGNSLGALAHNAILPSSIAVTIQRSHPKLHKRVLAEQSKQFVLALMSELASVDPKLAARIFETQEPGQLRNDILEALFTTWSKNDPQSSLDWLKTQNGSISSEVISIYAQETLLELAKTNPELAEGYLDLIISKQDQDNILSAISLGWVAQGSEAAFSWLEALRERNAPKELLEYAYINIMTQYAQESPHDAALILDTLNDDDLSVQLTPSVIAGLATENIEYAVEWINSAESIKIKTAGLRQLISM